MRQTGSKKEISDLDINAQNFYSMYIKRNVSTRGNGLSIIQKLLDDYFQTLRINYAYPRRGLSARIEVLNLIGRSCDFLKECTKSAQHSNVDP